VTIRGPHTFWQTRIHVDLTALYAAFVCRRYLIRKEMTLPDRLARTLRGRNAVLNIFELWVGLAGVVSGVIFFYDPAAIDNNALAQTIGFGLAATWNIMYFISGLLIWYGLLRPSPRMEVTGLFILGSATAISGVAIISFFGMRGAATASTLFALAIAAVLRGGFVYKAVLKWAERAPSS